MVSGKNLLSAMTIKRPWLMVTGIERRLKVTVLVDTT